MIMDIIEISGPALAALKAELAYRPWTVRTIRVANDGGVKLKINEGVWSAPFREER